MGATKAVAQGAPGAHTLPAPTTRFVGRTREIAEARAALSEARLLTFTGVGGCGKTHLAVHLAADLAPRFADGAWLVQLAPLTDPARLARIVAATLGVTSSADQPALPALVAALTARELLLVLDNCEHLIGACAELAEALLHGCPRIRVVTTSREPLRVVGEVIRRVPGLAVPTLGDLVAPAQLERVEAAALFLDRARARQPDFGLTATNAPTVIEICRRLEGLPLALELAAAQLQVLTVQQIAAQLSDPLGLLRGGSRTLPRQETLRATLDWSRGLLDDAERALFRRLAVFAGSFDARAANQVCMGEPLEAADPLIGLGQLVAKSLVEARAEGAVARYYLLEPMRQYASEQLRACHETSTVQQRHAQYYTALAEAAEPELMSAQRGPAIARLAGEEDNLRAALNWAQQSDTADALELGLRLASALMWFWTFRAQVGEGLDWLDALLARDQADVAPRVRASALHAAGELSWLVGRATLARARLEESAALFTRLGDARGVAYDLQALAMFLDDPAAAEHAAAESLRVFRDLGDTWGIAHATFSLAAAQVAAGKAGEALDHVLAPWRALGDEWGAAQALNFLGDVARSRGQDARAAACYQEALGLLRHVGITGSVPSLLHNLGSLALRGGDSPRAAQLLRESLDLFSAQGDQRGIADCLDGLAGVLGQIGRPEHAARLFGAAEALRETVGATVWQANAADLRDNAQRVRAHLGEAAMAGAWSAGRLLSGTQAIDEALAAIEHVHPAHSLRPLRSDPLSAREREVAALVARGLTNKEIAAQLIIGERTAATHVAHILDKLGLRGRAQIAAWGAEQGLIADAGTASEPRSGAVRPSVILRSGALDQEIRQPDDVEVRRPSLP